MVYLQKGTKVYQYTLIIALKYTLANKSLVAQVY